MTDKFVTVKIQDFGFGIPEKDRCRVFTPFAYSKEKRARIKGSALGLPIVRSIIDNKHGGALNFDAVENQGTIFYFTLPL